MVAGPEISRITEVLEQQDIKQQHNASNTGHHHHDLQRGVQTTFLKEVKAFVTLREEMANPFLEHS